jgi:hypothetical protein
MKPLQIGLLVAAGAIGGAFVVKMTQRPAEPPAVSAQAAPPTSVSVPTPATPAPEPTPAEPVAKPSPIPERTPAAAPVARKKPVAPRNTPAPAPRTEPVTVAQAQPAPTPATPAPTPAVEPAVQPAVPDPVPAPAPPPPPPPTVTLKAGSLLQVRLTEGLSTDRNVPGDTFTGTIDQPIVVDGMVIAERGSKVEGRVVASDRGGRVKGVSSLAIELTRLNTSDGQKIAIQTDSFEKHAESSTGSDVAKVGAVTAIGAAIGAIAGGGKGAAIGAATGGAAGTGGVLATRGKSTTLPSETRISFRLRNAVTITERGQ